MLSWCRRAVPRSDLAVAPRRRLQHMITDAMSQHRFREAVAAASDALVARALDAQGWRRRRERRRLERRIPGEDPTLPTQSDGPC